MQSQIYESSQDASAGSHGPSLSTSATLDGWTDVLLRGTAHDAEIFQEMTMLRAWGSRLVYELHPLKVAATKVERSKLQYWVKGCGLKIGFGRTWEGTRVSG